MLRRPIILVGVALAVSLTVLVVMGRRVLERDREALFAQYAQQRQYSLEEAARGLAGEIADIKDDLSLAATLLRGAESKRLEERELHAIATIKREYLVIYARTGGGTTTKVPAFDVPPRVAERADAALEAALDLAEAQPERLHVSGPYVSSSGEPAAWYRVFARRPTEQGPVVAVAVDMSVLLARLKLQRDAQTRILVVDARGATASLSDPALARFVREGRVRVPSNRTAMLDDDLARSIGLPSAGAVVVQVPLVVGEEPPWTLLAVSSLQGLQTQERVLVRRVLVGSALVLVLLLSTAGYVLRNMFRARALRERVQHMDRLAHLTEKAEKILDHIPSGVIALSKEQRITSVNRWLADRLGRDVTGLPLHEAFVTGRSEDVAVVVTLVENAVRANEPRSLHRERIAILGREAALNIHAVPLARGVSDVSVLLVFDDLTELRRIEERLLRSEKLVTAGQLAAGIAHEIGTPLNVARARAELSLSHLGGQHAEASNQQVVIDQIDRVSRLIQQLLDYVRPAPVSARDIDLAHALHVVRDLLVPQAAKRKVTLHVEAATQQLRADPDQVQQIVVNLVLNAIDACDPGGNVWLRAVSRDHGVMLEIADDGHGIPHEIQKQVFDPFFTTKKRGQGTGLGLWVVAQLVRAHGGELELDSKPGAGTRVRVTWAVRS